MRRASVTRHHYPSPRICVIVCRLCGCDGCDGFKYDICEVDGRLGVLSSLMTDWGLLGGGEAVFQEFVLEVGEGVGMAVAGLLVEELGLE